MKVKTIGINCWKASLQRIFTSRFGTSVLLMVALMCAMVTGIDKLMLDYQEWITPWMAPHIFNNRSFTLYFGFIVCYMYSDVPFMNRTELYKLLREGRLVWCMEKIASIILQAFFMTILTFLASVLVFIPRITFEMDWGKIIYTMAFSNNIYDYNIYGKSSPEILNKYSPVQAMVICFLLVWLATTLTGLFMFAVSLYLNRIFSVSLAVIWVGLQVAIDNGLNYLFLTYVTPFYWCRMSIHGEQAFLKWFYPKLSYCFTVGAVCIVVLLAAILLKIRKTEYDWSNEE